MENTSYNRAEITTFGLLKDGPTTKDAVVDEEDESSLGLESMLPL